MNCSFKHKNVTKRRLLNKQLKSVQCFKHELLFVLNLDPYCLVKLLCAACES